MISLVMVSTQRETIQDCSRCKHVGRCRARKTFYGKVQSDRNDTINILVCRLKLGIDINNTTKALMAVFKPGVLSLISSTKKKVEDGTIDYKDMIAEMHAYVIECILSKYSLGELNPVTNFLFGQKTGYLPKWCVWYINRFFKWNEKHVQSYDTDKNEEDDTYHEEDSEQHYTKLTDKAHVDDQTIDFEDPYTSSVVDDAMKIVEDGITLNMHEYRVMKFALQNANDGNDVRMIDGIHIHQAHMMGVSRPRATRLFKRAREKLRFVYLGQLEEVDDVDDLVEHIKFDPKEDFYEPCG